MHAPPAGNRFRGELWSYMVKKPQPKREVTQNQAGEELARKLLDATDKLRASGKFPRMQELVSAVRAQGVRLGWDAI